MTTAERPDDVVDGPDPVFRLNVHQRIERLIVQRCPCGYEVVRLRPEDTLTAMAEHLLFGHPAWRNPEIACQAREMSDDRWCVRPKGHDGDHWTPSFNGGFGWKNRS